METRDDRANAIKRAAKVTGVVIKMSVYGLYYNNMDGIYLYVGISCLYRNWTAVYISMSRGIRRTRGINRVYLHFIRRYGRRYDYRFIVITFFFYFYYIILCYMIANLSREMYNINRYSIYYILMLLYYTIFFSRLGYFPNGLVSYADGFITQTRLISWIFVENLLRKTFMPKNI